MLEQKERDELGDDIDKCVAKYPSCVDLLCQLRETWERERVIVEIAYTVGFLSPQDYDWIRQLSGEEVPSAAFTPFWNRDTGLLKFGGKLCRQLTVHLATKTVPILDQFQDSDWPEAIDYEFMTPDPQEIHQTCGNLNKNMKHISFHASGKKIYWRPANN